MSTTHRRVSCLAGVCAALVWGCASPRAPAAPNPGTPEYEVYAIRLGTLKGVPVSALVPGAEEGRTVDTAFMMWLIRGNGRTILVDSGFHRAEVVAAWHPVDFVTPVAALGRLGLAPDDVTDVVLTHLHWDHAGGVDLFPRARVWVQRAELEYYAAQASERSANAGVLAEDVLPLVALKEQGRVQLIEGDDRQIGPGITAYTGGKHTVASQFVAVATAAGTVVLASDNVFLYENLDRHVPITMTLDPTSNLKAQDRMIKIAAEPRLVIPGHDAQVMTRFPPVAPGVVRIR